MTARDPLKAEGIDATFPHPVEPLELLSLIICYTHINLERPSQFRCQE